MTLNVVGQDHPRPEVIDKVRGRPLFAADLIPENALVLKPVRSGRYHAEIVSLDLSAAQAVPGVVRIFTAQDIPGRNLTGIINKDHPILSTGKVRSKADAVALIAAETEEAAQAALKAVKIQWRDLPAVLSPDEALLPGAPKIHESGNVLFNRVIRRGDVQKALAEAFHIVTQEYGTSAMEHCCLEPDAGYGWIGDDGVLTVAVCTQNPHYDRADLASLLAVPEDQVRIVQTTTGGGFGSKLDLSVQSFIILALFHLQRPVACRYSREEVFLATSKRHPINMTFTTGVDHQGRLTAMIGRFLADGGAYGSYGIAVAARAATHATGPYEIPNVDIESMVVYTNRTFRGAMRGFGTPQVAFAIESQIELHAKSLGLDPLEMRLLNALKPGSISACGQVMGQGTGMVECLKTLKPHYLKSRNGWLQGRPSSPTRLRGLGLGGMWYGIGNTGAKNPSTAQIELNLDGRPTIFTGAADLGQGSTLVLAQLASEILGLRPEDFEIVAADTGRTTNAGATSASRQTYISGNAVCQAASALTDALKGCVSDLWQSSPEDIEIAEGMIKSKSRSVSMSLAQGAQLLVKKGQKLKYDGFFDPDSTALDDLGQGRPYGAYAFACQMAEIEVDALTGQVEVQRLVAAHDVGRAVSPSNIIGQICGGAAMGVGLALTEEFVDDDTESFKDYHLILASDMPKVEALIVECSEPTGPFGAKGIGEPALVPTAPAVVNALSMALGKRIIRLPASLEQVMKASLQAGWPNRVEELLRNWVNKPVES